LSIGNNTGIELLSPAKDFESGIAAINCGADAVYIGAHKYGARSAAGNSLKDIAMLIKYAHIYHANVYVTINTLLYDNELDDVQKLISQLYDAGADAVIIQDFAILQMDLPPIPLFASTQTNNTSPEKIKFIEQTGFSRVILARELSLEQIKKIRSKSSIGLEFFVHGALCVCYSGQCYFSFAKTGRSANRGECSQPCRMIYNLVDAGGNVIVKDKYLLSLKDLNLSLYLNDLIDAGITSFKIEGRLKDINYVKNITAYYRQKLDAILEQKAGFSKTSSGKVKLFFQPDPEKSFNRGFTDYFLNGNNPSISSFNSPKSLGKYLGEIISVHKDYFEINTTEKIVNGDGLCFFNDEEELTGMNINKVDGKHIYPNEMPELPLKTRIFRNSDHEFEKNLSSKYAERKISADIKITENNNIISILAVDEDNNRIEFGWDVEKQASLKPEKAFESFRSQLLKTGNSFFSFSKIEIDLRQSYFFPLSVVNNLRRKIILELEMERMRNHPRRERKPASKDLHLPNNKMDYRGNVTNIKALEFYGGAGVSEIEPGMELQNNFTGKVLMTCKYCIKNELGICPVKQGNKAEYKEPLYLIDKNKRYRLHFDCKKCEMSILS
jgi:putative protease